MKKIFLGLYLICAGLLTNAQNGLENILVEKYYVSNAADATGSIGTLPAGSVTYRIWADMLPNYKFQAAYGVPGHEFRIATTTAFFNNEDYGSTTPTVSATNVRKNSVLIDSYFSVGGAASGKVAVFKSEDNDGSTGNANNILQNNDPSATGAINIGATTSLLAQDGMITGTPQSVTFVGLSTADLDVFDGASNVGSLFTTSNGSVASLTGSLGATAANRVLIAQLTTNGSLSFKLNIQIGTPNGGIQQYVAENPVGNEIKIGTLIYPFVAGVSVTANPAGVICSKTNVTFTATPVNGGATPSYQWKKNGANVGTNSATYSNASLVNNDQITCVMTSNLSGVTGSPATSNTTTMQVLSLPSATVTPTGPTTFCSGTTPLTLGANSGTNLTYAWKKGSSFVAGATNISYVPTASGTYKVQVTNANGCTKLSSTGVTVTVNPLPTSTITPLGPLTFCAGGNVVLQANAGAGLIYQWKKGSNNIAGATLQNYTATQAATYKVIVTDANTCSKLSSGKKVVINCKDGNSTIDESVKQVSIFPNPSNGAFTLNFNDETIEDGTAKIELINVLGQNVYASTAVFSNGELNQKIDLENNSVKGLYLVRIELNGVVYNSRLILE